MIWAGSDDGLVHVTRDGGANWTNVTPPDMPRLHAHQPDRGVAALRPATAYVAAKRYQLDDRAPYLYKTHDYGKTWTKIVNGIRRRRLRARGARGPEARGAAVRGHGARRVRLVRRRRAAGSRCSSTCPMSPVHDLAVEDDDLIIATHGRSFYVLDDISAAAPAHAAGRGGGRAPVHARAGDPVGGPGRRRAVPPEAAREGAEARVPGRERPGDPQLRVRGAGQRARGAGAGWRRPVRRRADPRQQQGGAQPLRVGHALPRREGLPGHDPVGRGHARAAAPCRAATRSGWSRTAAR